MTATRTSLAILAVAVMAAVASGLALASAAHARGACGTPGETGLAVAVDHGAPFECPQPIP